MCIWREKSRQSLDFSPVSKPHTHITYMLRQCTSIVYVLDANLYILESSVLCAEQKPTCTLILVG
jgi:hypothetical protein